MVDSGTSLIQETVGRFLRQSYGDVPVDQDDDFVVRRDGTVAWVRPVTLQGLDVSVVVVWSTTNLDVPVTPELTRFLATEGANLTFGQFQLYEDPVRINVSHTLHGDFMSRQELEVAVDSVLSAARRYGPRIKDRFGGRLLGEQGAGTPDQSAAELLELLLRAQTAPRARRARTPRILQGVFGLLGLAAGVVGAIIAHDRTSSWALVVFVFLVASYLIGRGLGDVITDPHRIRRALYFLIPPPSATGAVYLTFRWWDRWWLAVLLGLTVGALIGGLIAVLLFPGIAREEMADDVARRRALLGGG